MFISEEHTDVLKLIRFIHKHMVGHNGVNFFRSLILNPVGPQYGHSQSEKKLGLGDKYHRSIKVHI